MERVEESKLSLIKVSDFSEKDSLTTKYEIEKRIMKENYEKQVKELENQNACKSAQLEKLNN